VDPIELRKCNICTSLQRAYIKSKYSTNLKNSRSVWYNVHWIVYFIEIKKLALKIPNIFKKCLEWFIKLKWMFRNLFKWHYAIIPAQHCISWHFQISRKLVWLRRVFLSINNPPNYVYFRFLNFSGRRGTPLIEAFISLINV